MKEKIIEILNNKIRVHQIDGPRVRLQWGGYNEAAEELAQMMCDREAKFIYGLHIWYGCTRPVEMTGQLLEDYYTPEQIEKALNKLK